MSVVSYSAWSTLALVGVLILIPASVWLVKKFTTFSTRTGGSLRVVESLAVGQRERLLVVHTGEQYLLIGSTANQMNLLRELPAYAEVQSTKGFGAVLKEVQARES
jgi:flagellar protein FliO/FliZ